MEMRSAKDVDILKKCYAAYPPLNTEWLDFRNELHMTSDKELFLENSAAGVVPLYEGKMIWQFNSTFEPPRLFLNPDQFDKYLLDTEARRIISDIYPALATETTPQIMAVLNELRLPYNPDNNSDNLKQLHSLVVADRTYWRLAFRAIASDTNERTLIFSLLPAKCGFGHSMFGSVPKKYFLDGHGVDVAVMQPVRLLFALGLFNSVVVDYLSRFVVQINVSKTYLERLPIPQPSDYEIKSNPNYQKLTDNALMLTLANSYDDFYDLAREFKISREDVELTDKQKERLQIENDLIVAKMYGITAADMQHIVESFKVLKNKKPQYVETLARSMVDQ